MNRARRLLGRLFDRGRRGELERRLQEELDTHLQMLVDEEVARGLSPQEARRKARLHLGGVEQTKEAVRDQRAIWFESVWRDIRYAGRLLRRTPVFASVAVLTVALGIGANTAIFSITDAVLLHPLPVPDPDRLLSFTERLPDIPNPVGGFLYDDFMAFRHMRSFEGVVAEGAQTIGVGDEEGTRRASLLLVSSDYFRVLGVRPHLGRWFLPGEERADSPPTAVLSYAAWRGWFNGDPSIVGKSVRLTGVPTVVVGVAPRGFQGTSLENAVDVFVPLLRATAVSARKLNFFASRNVDSGDGVFSPVRWLRVVGRLRPGVSRERAEAEARLVASSAGASGFAKGSRMSLVPAVYTSLSERDRGSNWRLAWLLGGIVGLVLLVGCTGLAGLLLARTENRRREMAARLAVGASRGRLLRQHLTETALLVFFGCAGGLFVSRSMLRVLSRFPMPGLEAIQTVDPRLNGTVLAFTVAAAVVTALLAGVVPAWRGSFADDVVSSLKTIGRTTARGRPRLQTAMLVVQIALTLVLLIGAGLFVRSVQAGLATDLGFRPDGAVTVDLNPRLRRYDPTRAAGLMDELVGRVQHLPGVESVTVGAPPLSGFPLTGPTLEAEGQRRRIRPYVGIAIVDRDFFRTLGIRLVRGRGFDQGDRADGQPVAVVNEGLARAFWPGQDPLGRQITRLPMHGSGVVPQAEVIGVAANASVSLRDRAVPVLYLLRAQNPIFNGDATSITVRVRGNLDSFAAVLRQQIREVDRDLPVMMIATMPEQIEKQLATERMGAWLAGCFGLLALLLAVIGTYGIVAYTVALRTPEIGLRIALGASPSRMPLLMLRVGLLPVLLGILLGTVAAWPATRLIRTFLFGVVPSDPVAFAIASTTLVGVAAAACYLAARRAGRVNPIETLRAE